MSGLLGQFPLARLRERVPEGRERGGQRRHCLANHPLPRPLSHKWARGGGSLQALCFCEGGVHLS